MVQKILFVVEAKQQRANYLRLCGIAEPSDDAIGRALLFDLLHSRAFPGLVGQIGALGDDSIQVAPGAQHELTDVVELLHYNNPLLLLIAAAQLQAFEDGPPLVKSAERNAEHPVFVHKPIKISEEEASAPIRKVYEDIKRTLGVPVVNTDYQAFARFPDFLNIYWGALKTVVSSPLYSENRRALHDSALTLAGDLPNAPQLTVERMQESGLGPEEISAAIRITEEFLDVLSGLVLNIAFAKISLEGGNTGKTGPRVEFPKRAA